MRRFAIFLGSIIAACVIAWANDFASPTTAAEPSAAASRKIYGEWRIQVRPDKGPEYADLIRTKGLPLFRAAGGRMVGWWTTLIGDLYEHVTIWEYDDMAAFDAAIAKLGNDKDFAAFVALRDPLLAGEQNQFLRLVPFSTAPALPEPAAIVVHEVHRIPLSHRDAYLKFMQTEGLALLARHGIRPVGPWLVDVGRWNEVTYLVRFGSLAEREKVIEAFATQRDAQLYADKLNQFEAEVTTRVLMPAKFAHP